MRFALHQFSGVFKIRDAAGQPYILIGGQAVNYWAERYLSAEPELKLLQPFSLRGDRSGEELIKKLKAAGHYPYSDMERKPVA